jgi:hypothetical protein
MNSRLPSKLAIRRAALLSKLLAGEVRVPVAEELVEVNA